MTSRRHVRRHTFGRGVSVASKGTDMTGISPTGLGLPTAQSLFTGGSGSYGAATDPNPASTVPVNGPTVSGPGGTTALPQAAPADFQGVNPTALDQPHPQYPSLIQSHVAVLQAIGTPESVIAQIAGSQPSAEYLDRYIQGEIAQNPEGWDSFVGNPAGTARAGLQQLGFNPPAAGTGTPGVMPDGGRVDGINVPGVTQPLVGPQQSSGEGLINGIVIAAAVAGVGLLAWKFMKGRNAAKDAAQLIGTSDQAKGLLAGAAAGEGTGGAQGLRNLIEVMKGGSEAGAGLFGKGDEAGKAAQRLLSMQAIVGGGTGSGGWATAASLESVQRGLGVSNGFIDAAGNSALKYNMSMPLAIEAALADRGMGVLEQLARNGGGVADLAAARALTTQLAGTAGAAGGAAANQLAGLRQALAGLVNAAV